MVCTEMLLPQFCRDQREQIALDLVDGAAGKNLGAILGPDHVLQDKPRIVLHGQFGGEAGDHVTGLKQADGAEDGAGGEVAIFSVHDLGADDEDGDLGSSQNGLGHRADQKLADRAGRMCAHDDAVDLTLPQKVENLVGGQPGADHDFAWYARFA